MMIVKSIGKSRPMMYKTHDVVGQRDFYVRHLEARKADWSFSHTCSIGHAKLSK